MKKALLKSIQLTFSLALLVALGGLSGVSAVELKLAHFMPPRHIQHRENFIPFAEKVAQLSGGEVTVKIYAAGALGGPKQLYDAVKAGVTDIAFVIPSYVTGRFLRSSCLELPFLFESGVHLTRVAYEVYEEQFAKDFDEVKLLYMYAPGLGQLHSAGDPIRVASDVKGMKIRSPNSPMTDALKQLGANPVGMPISKLAISLERRVIDGVLTPYSAIQDFSLYQLVNSVTRVNMYGTFMVVVMNKGKFNSLSKRGQKAIMDAGGKEWGLHVAEVYHKHDLYTINKIKTDSSINIELRDMSNSDIEKMRQQLSNMYEDWVSSVSQKRIPARKVLDDVIASARRTQ